MHKLGRDRLGSGDGGRPGSAPRDRLSSISTTSIKSNVSDSDVSEADSIVHPGSGGSGQPPQDGNVPSPPGTEGRGQ